MARNYKKKSSKAKTPKKTVRLLRPKKTRTFEKRVMSVIHKQAENKVMNYLFPRTDLVPYLSAAWGGLQCFPLSPYGGYASAVQGSAQNQRIGNSVNIKKATIKLLFNQNPYNVTTNITPVPLLIRIITFYDKSFTTALPTLTANLYQNGSSSTNPSQGENIDILKSFNRDQWVVKSSKIIKLGYSNYQSGAGGSITNQYHANNEFPMFNTFSMDYTKHLVKQVKWNDTTVNPTSRGLFCAIYIMAADGSSILTAQRPANFQGFINIEYEDM